MGESGPPQIGKRTETEETWNKNVLVADDTKAMLSMTATILKILGCTVETVENGQELMDRLATAKPGEFGLVITDIEMPKMDGMQALAKIRADNNLKQLHVIVYSGDISNEIRNKKIVDDSGAVYLAKPFSVNQLSEAIEKSLKI